MEGYASLLRIQNQLTNEIAIENQNTEEDRMHSNALHPPIQEDQNAGTDTDTESSNDDDWRETTMNSSTI